MRCLFISDAHYPLSTEIENFLLKNHRDFDVIYILGDIFEFYYGYRNFIYPHHFRLINTLSLVAHHTNLVIFEGNHEYALEGITGFVKNIKVVKHSITVQIDGFKVYMEHGDTIDKSDLGYRIFRKALKNPFMLSFIGTLPSSWLLELSKLASGFSKSRLKSPIYRKTDRELEKFARMKIESGYDAVILAHTHSPVMKKMGNGLYINTGDFLEHFSYVTYESSCGFKMNRYREVKNEKG